MGDGEKGGEERDGGRVGGRVREEREIRIERGGKEEGGKGREAVSSGGGKLMFIPHG